MPRSYPGPERDKTAIFPLRRRPRDTTTQGRTRMTRTLALAAGAALAALLAGTAAVIWLLPPSARFAGCGGGRAAGGSATVGGPFTLLDQTGTQVIDADAIQGLTPICFGYTFCPDIRPFDVARNAAATDLLERRGIEVTPVMITVDPERDTPQVMARHTGYMHPPMIGLTGPDGQVGAGRSAYRTITPRRPARSRRTRACRASSAATCRPRRWPTRSPAARATSDGQALSPIRCRIAASRSDTSVPANSAASSVASQTSARAGHSAGMCTDGSSWLTGLIPEARIFTCMSVATVPGDRPTTRTSPCASRSAHCVSIAAAALAAQ
ncbi:hypothetical protein GE300_07390 [Rhodobacteraceae bacterium 2CG4]|uniref:SCO family protein n=1 Tax=Halovulum marinum TaxID=2662447 RepID=A0A6L5YYZ9_9RHOB|nr:hypothetical protein [Halovulum marinum]